MANFEPIRMFKNITGRLAGKSQIMMRCKKFGLSLGKLIKEGPREIYVKERRDYRLHPLTAGERTQLNRWTAVCREASQIVHNPNHPRYAEFNERWERLQRGEADPTVGMKQYMQFGNYVRSVLLREGR